MPPSSEGGSQVTVTLYGPMEGKDRFSGLPGGAGGGVEWEGRVGGDCGEGVTIGQETEFVWVEDKS